MIQTVVAYMLLVLVTVNHVANKRRHVVDHTVVALIAFLRKYRRTVFSRRSVGTYKGMIYVVDFLVVLKYC